MVALNQCVFTSCIYFYLYIFCLFPHLHLAHVLLYILKHIEHIFELAFQAFLFANFIISIIPGSVLFSNHDYGSYFSAYLHVIIIWGGDATHCVLSTVGGWDYYILLEH